MINRNNKMSVQKVNQNNFDYLITLSSLDEDLNCIDHDYFEKIVKFDGLNKVSVLVDLFLDSVAIPRKNRFVKLDLMFDFKKNGFTSKKQQLVSLNIDEVPVELIELSNTEIDHILSLQAIPKKQKEKILKGLNK